MEVFEKDKKVWEKIYESDGSYLEYPNENLVVFVHRYFKERKGKKLLDLGFGSGNNLIHLLKSWFECYGCEISQSALELTKKRSSILGLSVDLRLLKDEIPYPDKFFDKVVAWQVLYYNNLQSLKFMIKEKSRVLKVCGKILVTLVRKNDIIVECADKIDDKTYRVNSKLPSQEGAIIYVVGGEEDIKELFDSFGNLKIGYFESSFDEITSSHWLIYGEKHELQ
jgi:cyclopropane fatty-acyl-phospholipid synthase-like methyltransferase